MNLIEKTRLKLDDKVSKKIEILAELLKFHHTDEAYEIIWFLSLIIIYTIEFIKYDLDEKNMKLLEDVNLFLDTLTENIFFSRIVSQIIYNEKLYMPVFEKNGFSLENHLNNFVLLDQGNIKFSSTLNIFLGSGSFGSVYLKEYDEKKVAVKYFKKVNTIEDFYYLFKEIIALNYLKKSTKVCDIIGSGIFSGNWVIIMQKIQFCSINFVHSPYFKKKHYHQIFKQLFEGIDELHSNDMVHCDIKPCNVMLNLNDDGDVMLKIIDFGLCEFITNEKKYIMSEHHDNFYSLWWRSPELLNKEPFNLIQTDVWACGITILDIFVGKCLFNETDSDTFINHFNQLNLQENSREKLKEQFCEVDDYLMLVLEKYILTKKENRKDTKFILKKLKSNYSCNLI